MQEERSLDLGQSGVAWELSQSRSGLHAWGQGPVSQMVDATDGFYQHVGTRSLESAGRPTRLTPSDR
ncbi:MAG: hypothetical protein JO370_05385 [Paucibacter sp.]|nr:hypothetical protein [Roseateles sp.]